MKAETLFDLAHDSESVSKTLANIANVCKTQEWLESGLPAHITIGLNTQAVAFTIDGQHPCAHALHELLRQLIAHEQLSVCDELNTMSRRINIEEVSK